MRRLASSLLLLGLVACGPKPGPKGPPPAKVKLQTLKPQDVKQTADFIASLNSRNAVILRPQVNAVVAAIPSKSGDRVKAGATIVQLDVSQQAAVTANVRATVEARRAALRLAEANYERLSKLAPSGVVSGRSSTRPLPSAPPPRPTSPRRRAGSRAQSVQSSYYRIGAPFDGIVGDLPVKVGNLVTPQTPITPDFTQDGRLEAYVNVPLLLAPRSASRRWCEILGNDDQPVVEAPVSFISPHR